MTRANSRLAVRAARVRWEVRRGWARVTWTDFAAMAAIGFWVGLALLANRPLRQELRALRIQAAALPVPVPARPTEPATIRAADPNDPAERIAAFMAFLPPASLREQQLQTLHALAGQNGLVLAGAEYGHGELPQLPGRRTTLQLSTVSGYPAYRKFLRDLQVGLPNMTVDRVSTDAITGQPGVLNVRIEASLHYRDGNVATAP